MPAPSSWKKRISWAPTPSCRRRASPRSCRNCCRRRSVTSIAARGWRRRPALRHVLAIVGIAAALQRALYVVEVHDHRFWRVPLVDAADYHARAVRVMRGEGLGPEVFYKAPAYTWLVGQV